MKPRQLLVRPRDCTALRTRKITHADLLTLREHLALLGKAAGLPAQLFTLDTRNTKRFAIVAQRMDVILTNTVAMRPQLPDKQRVDQLVIRGRTLIDQQRAAIQDSDLLRIKRSQDTKTRMRLERLLYDVLLHLSAQGLAAYPEDPEREPIYRLDHIYGQTSTTSQTADDTSESAGEVAEGTASGIIPAKS